MITDFGSHAPDRTEGACVLLMGEMIMENFFHLKERGTDVRTECIAGLTTFMTMAYIIAVNPNILGDAGMNPHAVLIATCLASTIGCFCMGFMANLPFALNLNAL